MKKSSLIKQVLPIAAGSLLLAGCEVRVVGPPPPVVVRPAPVVVEAPAVSAEVEVGVAPPPPQVDVMVASPGPEFVWIGGAWAWRGGAWRWEGGHWSRPPRRGVHWVAHHYDARRHVWVEGHWGR